MRRDLGFAGALQSPMILWEVVKVDVLRVFRDPPRTGSLVEADDAQVPLAHVEVGLLEAQGVEADLVDQQGRIGDQASGLGRRDDPAAPAERAAALDLVEIVHPHQTRVGPVADNDEVVFLAGRLASLVGLQPVLLGGDIGGRRVQVLVQLLVQVLLYPQY